MITRCFFVLAALLVNPMELCQGFKLFQGSCYLQNQNLPVQRSLALKFMSAVTDLPLQSINNLSTASATELTFVIKEAKMQDFASIVSLRVNVFYPEVTQFFSSPPINARSKQSHTISPQNCS